VRAALEGPQALHTGKTADNLFVRSHTFNKEPRPSGKGAADMGPPQYYE
jgi:hypothetical protein